MFLKIYNNLMTKGSLREHEYVKFSGLHRHHIIPLHMGGTDDKENLTYLTVREHIIAHYILWKIHKTPNDLRAMKMLGANITVTQRIVIGQFCRDNKIGFYSDKFTKEMRISAAQKGVYYQMQNKLGIHTDDQSKRAEWASLGGKSGSLTQIQNKLGIHTDDQSKRAEWASLGGKSHKGKKWVHNPITNKRYRCKPEELEQYLDNGFKLGTGISKVS